MNNDRIQEILDLMEEARLDYFLISDPQSIAYCTGYYNDPHERMFVFMISKHGNHTLFMNDLFYLDHDLDVNIVWHKDGQDAIQTIVDEMHFPGRIGIDKKQSEKSRRKKEKVVNKTKGSKRSSKNNIRRCKGRRSGSRGR